MKRLFAFTLLLSLALPALSSTTFTYQGQLLQNGQPYTGTATLVFELFDAETGGNEIGELNGRSDWPIENGLFQVELGFGPNTFDGSPRYLQVTVVVGANSYTLQPRQPIRSAPMALYALSGAGESPWQVSELASPPAIYYDPGAVAIGTEFPGSAIPSQLMVNAKIFQNAIFGSSPLPGGQGVYGRATATSGFNAGVVGQTLSPDGYSAYFAGVSGSRNYFERPVGIGTTSPNAQLHVAQDSGIPLLVSLGGQPRLFVSGNGGTSLGTNQSPPALGLRVQGPARLDGKASVNTGATTRDLTIKQSSISNTSIGIHLERSNSSDNWGIYMATTNNLGFVINGDLVSRINAGSGAYELVSDARVKDTVEPLAPVLERLLKLNPSSYFMKSDDRRHAPAIGLIAQEVEPLFPEIVTRMDDEGDLMGLRYSELSVLNVQAIIELNARLESNVSTLADENAELRAEVAVLKVQSGQMQELEQRLAAVEEREQEALVLRERLAVLESLLLERAPVVAETGR